MNTVLIESINSRAISNNVINKRNGTSQLNTIYTTQKIKLDESFDWIKLIILETNEWIVH